MESIQEQVSTCSSSPSEDIPYIEFYKYYKSAQIPKVALAENMQEPNMLPSQVSTRSSSPSEDEDEERYVTFYKYYIALAVNTVKRGNIEEISDIGIRIIDVGTSFLAAEYCASPPKRILTDLNTFHHSSGFPLTISTGFNSFEVGKVGDRHSCTLWKFIETFSSAFRKSLIVVIDDTISRHIKSQYLIDTALEMAPPHTTYVDNCFAKWCNLAEVQKFIFQNEQEWNLASLLHYHNLSFGELNVDGEGNVLDKCRAIHKLIKTMEATHSEDFITLYPTHQMKTILSEPKPKKAPSYVKPRQKVKMTVGRRVGTHSPTADIPPPIYIAKRQGNLPVSTYPPTHHQHIMASEDIPPPIKWRDSELTPKYYIILHTITTREGNLREIVQIAFRVLNAQSLIPVASFESVVRPSILTTFGRNIEKDLGIKYEDTEHDFATVLQRIAENFEWAFRKGLVLTIGDSVFEDIESQYKVEKALKRTNLPDMSFLSQSCNLTDLYACERGVDDLEELIIQKLDKKGLRIWQISAMKFCNHLLLLLPILKELEFSPNSGHKYS